MDESDVEDFDKFVEKHWGFKNQTVPVTANVEEENTKRRLKKKK